MKVTLSCHLLPCNDNGNGVASEQLSPGVTLCQVSCAMFKTRAPASIVQTVATGPQLPRPQSVWAWSVCVDITVTW